jgi:hypothetical protein
MVAGLVASAPRGRVLSPVEQCLAAKIAVMREHVEGPDGGSHRRDRHRGRTIAAAVLGALAVLALTVTVVAVWAEATVLRSEPVADLVGDALAEPQVQSALAAYVTDQVVDAVDLEALLANLLPDGLDRFAPTIAGGAQAAVQRRLTDVIANPDVQHLLSRSVERAHRAAMQLLQGDGLMDGVTVADGAVSVNLLPVVARGLTALQSIGLLQDVEIPPVTADGDPTEQLAALSTALNRELPDDLGQLVVYRGSSVTEAQESVQTARRLLALAQRAVWVLAGVSIVLIVATVAVAARRWRAALILAAGTAATMIVTRAAVRQVVDDAPAVAAKPGGRAAIDAIVSGASTSLLRLTGVVLLTAIAAVAITLLRTGWRRGDLVLVAATASGAATIAALGVSLLALLVGVAVAVAVPFVVRWLGPTPAAA